MLLESSQASPGTLARAEQVQELSIPPTLGTLVLHPLAGAVAASAGVTSGVAGLVSRRWLSAPAAQCGEAAPSSRETLVPFSNAVPLKPSGHSGGSCHEVGC